jgi:uncharacterized protein YndB with AHSA1/START domain
MWMVVIGWIFTLLVSAALIASAVLTKFMEFKPPEGAPDTGWSQSANLGLGIVEVGCAVIYFFPRTAVLGAVLITAYMGGAVATHVRIGDFFVPQMLVAVFAWFGLFMRDERVRDCLPWRRDPAGVRYGGFLVAVGKILLTLLVLVGVISALVLATPPDYKVTRTVTIDAPPSKVFEQVNNFHNWKAWSPWEELAKDATKTIEGPDAGVGAIYKWDGEKAGEGKMEILESRPNEKTRIKLEFTRPWQAAAINEFTFKEDGGKTVVTWTMTGRNDDFPGKAITIFMVTPPWGVGKQFEEGLKNLKAVAEKK